MRNLFTESDTGCPAPGTWQQLLDGVLDAGHEAALLIHLEACEICAEAIGSQHRRWGAITNAHHKEGHSSPPSFGTDKLTAMLERASLVRSFLAEVTDPNTAPPEIPGLDDLVEVGRGGMGVVYRARERDLNRSVAVKLLTTSAMFSRGARVRAHQEAAIMARLNHPNIVPIYRSGEVQGVPYFVMEWIPGGNLQERIDTQLPSPRDAVGLVKDLASAVAVAHSLGIIHRDLKPANILLAAPQGAGHGLVPKLADFGLARPESNIPRLTDSGMVMGTLSYIAPEQTGISNNPALTSTATDIHGLGAILYSLLTGHAPYEGVTRWECLLRAADARHLPLEATRRKIPRDLATIVETCLHVSPQRRYRSATELADELDRFLAGKPILARTISFPERLWKWARRHQVAALSGLFLTLGAAAGLAGTAYYVRSIRHAMAALSLADSRTKSALELAGIRGEHFQKSLSTFDADLIQRFVDRGSALNSADRSFLLKVRELYENAPQEPDTVTGLQNLGARMKRLAGVFFQISQYEDASECQKKGIAAYQQVLELEPDNLETQIALLHTLADFHESLMKLNRFPEAETAARQLIDRSTRLAQTDSRQRLEVARALIKLGVSLDGQKRFDESQEPISEALQILERLRPEYPQDLRFWTAQYRSLWNAALSSSTAGRPEESEARLKMLLYLASERVEISPEISTLSVEMQCRALMQLTATYSRRNEYGTAERTARQYLEVSRNRFQLSPESAFARDSFGDACGIYYDVCRALDRPRDAEADLLSALQRAGDARKAEPAIFDRSRALIFLQEQAADLFQRTGRPAEALAMNACVLESARPWLPLEGFAAEVRGNLALALTRLSEIYSELGNHAEAVRLLQEKVKLVDPEAQPQVQAQIVLEQLSDRADQVALDLPRLTGRPGSEP